MGGLGMRKFIVTNTYTKKRFARTVLMLSHLATRVAKAWYWYHCVRFNLESFAVES